MRYDSAPSTLCLYQPTLLADATLLSMGSKERLRTYYCKLLFPRVSSEYSVRSLYRKFSARVAIDSFIPAMNCHYFGIKIMRSEVSNVLFFLLGCEHSALRKYPE